MKLSLFAREFAGAAALAAAALAADRLIDSRMLSDSVLRLCSLGLFAVSLNLLVGYTGLLSFGQATFFASGAYLFTFLMQRGGISIPSAFALTLLGSLALAWAVGAICVRLSGVYFTFLTLAVQMMFHSTLIAWSALTGGEQGLTGGLPKPPFFGIDLADRTTFFVVNVTIFAACLLALRGIVRSPFGAALKLIRDNPERALFLGVPVQRYRLYAFIISSAFTAVAGVLMSLFVSGAFPNFAYWSLSGEGLFMIMLGGVSSFFGPMLGAALLIVLEGLVNAHFQYHGLVVGLVILFAVLVLRKGVVDFWAERLALRRQRAATLGVAQ